MYIINIYCKKLTSSICGHKNAYILRTKIVAITETVNDDTTEQDNQRKKKNSF